MLRSMKLKCLNPHITCVLCGGYLVDATTIIECLHSFCRSCIVRYLETSFQCPVCDVEIHKTRPLLHIKPDRVLQDIVYKLVPGFCHDSNNEEQRTSHGTDAADVKSKQNVCPDIDDPVCLQLEYYGRTRYHRTEEQIFPTRYLRCSSNVTVGVLKKFLSIKFGIPPTHQPQLVRSDEILDNHITMTELSRIYGLYAKSFLDIQYIFLPNKEDDELKTEGQEAKRVKIDHLQQYRHNELQQLKRKRKRKRRLRKNNPKEDRQQQHILPKQRKIRTKDVIQKERQEQGSNELKSSQNELMTEDLQPEQRYFYQPMAERLGENSVKQENSEHPQPMPQPNEQHAEQRKQERDRTTENQTTIELQYQKEQEEQPLKQQPSTPEDRLSIDKQQADQREQERDGTTENQTTIELQYEKEQEEQPLKQQPSTPEDRLSIDKQQADQREQERDRTTENQTTIELQYEKEQEEQLLKQQPSTPEDRLSIDKQLVDGCYQNRTEQTNVQQTANHQSKENAKLDRDSVCDKQNFYQLNKHIVSTAKNCTETESRDKQSLESFKLSPHPLRSRNLDNTTTNCAETRVCPLLWNGIEPTAF